MKDIEEEIWKTAKNILALWRSWWVLKGHIASKKPSNLIVKTLERKTGQGIN